MKVAPQRFRLVLIDEGEPYACRPCPIRSRDRPVVCLPRAERRTAGWQFRPSGTGVHRSSHLYQSRRRGHVREDRDQDGSSSARHVRPRVTRSYAGAYDVTRTTTRSSALPRWTGRSWPPDSPGMGSRCRPRSASSLPIWSPTEPPRYPMRFSLLPFLRRYKRNTLTRKLIRLFRSPVESRRRKHHL